MNFLPWDSIHLHQKYIRMKRVAIETVGGHWLAYRASPSVDALLARKMNERVHETISVLTQRTYL